MKSDKTLDCVGLFCPMPIVKTKQEIQKIQSGQILEILADDPGFEKDLPAWCNMTGEKFLGMEKEGKILKGHVMKK